jgi:D-sedoheptulose 7-phosphate isomerase
MNQIEQRIDEAIRVQQELLKQTDLIQSIVDKIVVAFGTGNKLLICGNGGSAADAQHIAAEFVGKFLHERHSLPAMALNTNTSTITAIANDYSYDRIFARQVEAFAQSGDIFVAISTSGNSRNVVKATLVARQRGCLTIGFTGKNGGRLQEYADICLCVPSSSTPRIQESHITIWHIICELVELAFVNDRKVTVSYPARSGWRN